LGLNGFGGGFRASTRPTVLLADNNASEYSIPILGIDFNLSIGHGGFPEENIQHTSVFEISGPFQVRTDQSGPGEIGIFQVGIDQNSSSQVGFTQTSPSQVGFSQIGIPQTRISQVSISQVGTSESSTGQTGTSQISPTKIGISQTSRSQVGTDQISPVQVSPNQVDEFQLSLSQTDSTKISFASSVASEQFFNSHNTSPTSIYNINNTALTFWNSYLQTTTPFKLNIEIADLPTVVVVAWVEARNPKHTDGVPQSKNYRRHVFFTVVTHHRRQFLHPEISVCSSDSQLEIALF
jgi:hypothetical protein